MDKRELRVGEIVQVDPTVKTFGGCLVTVTEPKSFGCMGYVQNAGQEGQAYIRLPFSDIEPTGGYAEWAAIEKYDNKASKSLQTLIDTLQLAHDTLSQILTPAIDAQLGPKGAEVHKSIDRIAEAMSLFTTSKRS